MNFKDYIMNIYPKKEEKRKSFLQFDRQDMIFIFLESYERSGRLFKKNKAGELKEKEFVLYKDNLIYFKPGEKSK